MSIRVMSREEYRHSQADAGWHLLRNPTSLPEAIREATTIRTESGREVALIPGSRDTDPGRWWVAVLAPDLPAAGWMTDAPCRVPPLPKFAREVVA